MFNVNFDLQDPQVVCHDQYRALVPKILESLKPFDLKDHFILFSSGTTGGDLKGYALSKKALFANAQAVNQHFSLTASDVWGLSLPIYHVGGLSVLARAHLLNNKIIDGRHWEPDSWLKKIEDVTITTVVPTQLYDLIKRKLSPPKALRYLIVGGDFLSSALKSEAMNLGWPVIRTFGMSEVCSQLASTRNPQSDDLEILPIHSAKTEDEKLLVKTESLFTLEFILGEEFIVTPARDLCTPDGFYITKDRACVDGSKFKHLGRMGDEVKISGHLVNLNILRNQLSSFLFARQLFGKLELIFEPDERKGHKLILLSLINLEADHLEKISQLILPVKIDEIRMITEFKRTELGKLKKN